MADAIVSVVLEQLASVVRQEVKLFWGVGNEVKKLTSYFQTIQAVLLDAEQRQVTEPAVRDWLEKLKDVSYDMDDVLDKWNTAIQQRLRIERAENAHTLKSKVCSCFIFPYSCLRRVVLHSNIAFKIKAINESVDAIAKERDMHNFKIATNSIERVESTSFIDVSEVFGRDEEKNALVGKLLCESCEERNNPQIISIVGMGGIGKTTLAQLAYNSNEVIQHFEKRIWVCVSEPFDMLRIARAILENLEGHTPNLSTLQSLLEKISESLKTKKFIIVLDDVWTEDYKHWEPFHHCLKKGLNGSKILVTTRKQTTADMMRSIDTIPIEKISEEKCWSLFWRLAFYGRPHECKTLEDIGRKIVSKCKGLPLAAKTMGSLLRFKNDKKEWENILCSEMWKLEEFEKGVVPPLLLSYYDLPSEVKRCFTYCAMFPKAFNFEKDKLIKLWMAQGYLGLEHNEEMETIGEKYFNKLAMLSFFQEFEKDDDGSIMRCKMHDIVHDVAQFLSKNECYMIEDKDLKEEKMNALCEKAHQLMLVVTQGDTIPTSICNFKKLRSLLFQIDCGVVGEFIGSVLLPRLFDELGYLKTLGISSFPYRTTFKHIPKRIGKLIHLRYLDLSGNYELIKLPETLCELYNLQTLNLDDCYNLEELPQGIGKLINLRHLMNKGTTSLRYMPKGIERLTNLRTLSEFRVCSGDYGGKACSLECLNNLRHLESLGIAGWENLRMDQIVEFKINKNIRVLRLVFNRADQRADPMKDEAILKAFQPPPDLQRLTITNYGGHTMSGLRVTSLNNLKWIKLQLSLNCLPLTPLGKLRSLETLSIGGWDSMSAVGNEFLGVESDDDTSSSSSFISFPRLKTLKISRMGAWEVWDFGIDDRVMPSLRSLEIRDCILKGLPKQLLQMAPLQNLFIEHCPILKELYAKGTGEKWQDISHIPNIQII
ncbi:hypothetical protein ACOSQ2_020649 [Xanthoceras sorbifolium]